MTETDNSTNTNNTTTTLKCEYIWVDGGSPTPSIRSKTKVLTKSFDPEQGLDISIRDFPIWSFDGSSTGQADGQSSDCVLVPVFACSDPNRGTGILVLCEVLNYDQTPHQRSHGQLLFDIPAQYAPHSNDSLFCLLF